MKLSKKYSTVSVPSRVPAKSGGESVFTTIQRSLSQVASRVGSALGEERTKGGVVFYLKQRPKDRQGRLDWNQEVERVSGSCKASTGRYASSIIVARNGHELELKRK